MKHKCPLGKTLEGESLNLWNYEGAGRRGRTIPRVDHAEALLGCYEAAYYPPLTFLRCCNPQEKITILQGQPGKRKTRRNFTPGSFLGSPGWELPTLITENALYRVEPFFWCHRARLPCHSFVTHVRVCGQPPQVGYLF